MSSGGKVGHHFGSPHPYRRLIDHVEIGPVAGRHNAAVEEADRLGGGTALAGHQERQVDPAPGAVPAPVGQQRGRKAGVRNCADVGAAVGKAGHGVRVGQHLADRVEVAGPVVHHRRVEERGAVA